MTYPQDFLWWCLWRRTGNKADTFARVHFGSGEGGNLTGRDRKEVIADLEAIRKSRVICYVTSTRSGLEAPMAMDVIPVIYRHLRTLDLDPRKDTIDLFLHSNGGDGVVPWRLVTLIREYCKVFNVLIPHLAYSAATLTALGADSIVMHPMGVLGPTDPTVANAFNPPDPRNPAGQPLGIAVEDVTSYFALVKEDIGIRHEDELVQALIALTGNVHPLALGNVKRSTLQSRMLGKSLLQARRNKGTELSEQQIIEIVERLTSQLYYHGHPIGRNEARVDVGLPFVVDATADEEATLWELYESFEDSMKFGMPFNLIGEALAAMPIPVQSTLPLSTPGAPAMAPPQQFPQMPQTEVDLTELVMAIVESTNRTDRFTQDLRVSLLKQPLGYQVSALPLNAGWTEITPDV